MTLLHTKTPLESVAIDILGYLIRTQCSQLYIVVVMWGFYNLAKAIPRNAISPGKVDKLFVDNIVINYRPPKKCSPTTNQNLIHSQLLTSSPFMILKSDQNAYNPQINEKSKRSQTNDSHLISTLHGGSLKWLRPLYPALMFSYNSQRQCSTSISSLELDILRPRVRYSPMLHTQKLQHPDIFEAKVETLARESDFWY